MSVLAVVVVARAGPSRSSALEPLAGPPPVARSVRAVRGVPGVGEVVVLAPDPEAAHACRTADAHVVTARGSGRPGAHAPQRPDHAGGDAPITAGRADVVIVLDGARPFVPPALVGRVVDAVRAGHRAVVPVLPLSDTVKRVDAAGLVTATPDRAGLRVVQTPQGFAPDLLDAALAAALDDPARAWTAAGVPAHAVDGDPLAFAVLDAWHRDVARAFVEVA